MYNYDINEILADIRSDRKKKIIFDTDAYNEIDDQFAIAYCLKCTHMFDILGFTAAPFLNSRCESVADGIEKSYNEIKKVMRLVDPTLDYPVFKGSLNFLKDENTPEESDAADFMIKCALESDERIYILAIGAITNVASALLKCPEIKDKIVVVWIGTNAKWSKCPGEFNMNQDIASGRVLLSSGEPVMLVPVVDVVTPNRVSLHELGERMPGKSELSDYLYNITVEYNRDEGPDYTMSLCDIMCITAMANNKDVDISIENAPLLNYNRSYTYDDEPRQPILLVNKFVRDSVFGDLFDKLGI